MSSRYFWNLVYVTLISWDASYHKLDFHGTFSVLSHFGLYKTRKKKKKCVRQQLYSVINIKRMKYPCWFRDSLHYHFHQIFLRQLGPGWHSVFRASWPVYHLIWPWAGSSLTAHGPVKCLFITFPGPAYLCSKWARYKC